MQGPGSSLSTLPENLSFDHGSTSSDSGIDSQMSWNNSIQISAQNRLPEYRISSNETHNQYLQHVRHDGRNTEWSLGETSSSAAQRQGSQNERKTEHAWNFFSRATLNLEERQYEPHGLFPSENVEVNSNGNQTTTNGSFLLQNSSSNAIPQDLNMISGFENQEDDDCQVIERLSSRISIGSTNEQIRPTGGSSGSFGGGYLMDESEDRPGYYLDGRRMSCKRKALEMHAGPSSGVGSSIFFRMPKEANGILHHLLRLPQATLVCLHQQKITSTANPRLRLGVGGPVSSSPFSLTPSGYAASSRRNVRLRINGLHQQDPIIPENPFLNEPDVGNVDVSSSRHSSRLVLRNRLSDLNPAPAVENGSLHLPNIPSARRNHQSRWSGTSNARSSRSSATTAISEERNATLYEEPAPRTIPIRIPEQSMFVPTSEMGNSSQSPINWNLSGGGNTNSIAGNVASTSRGRVGNSSAPSWSHRSYPQYPRRLSEIVRRSLLSSAGDDSGSRSINRVGRSGSSATASQEMTIPSGPDNHGHHAPNSRSSLLERHLDGAFGLPYSLRTLAAASEGRSSIMSEIRHVLDLMRRGEALRFEDMMILDHSVLFGMADIHDRHRDMRLDVDNMSYEELLALEERIGNVCTGLSEETILSRLKQKIYVDSKAQDQVETEPCSICREEYNDGEDLGTLECGHDFHKECIKQWLLQKNLCPICKTTGLAT
ncbi:hypothetical protein DH2020_004058 [Rehmannia glutinosa]|uniref:RING-type E3 ubiquitin transferase n=1 Tax=Rehmannia glutinosa TaxID=99300 RepID=A0ABR0XNH4_REHGL